MLAQDSFNTRANRNAIAASSSCGWMRWRAGLGFVAGALTCHPTTDP
jgi:hypothetical protein